MNPLTGLRTDKLVHLHDRFVDSSDSCLVISNALCVVGGIA
jgi:hypothetical protein